MENFTGASGDSVVFRNSGAVSKSRSDFVTTLGARSHAYATYRRIDVKHPVTPDGRYMVVRGRLWRVANPQLPKQEREAQVQALMSARREVKAAMAAKDQDRLAAARESVNIAKIALGERGPVWWDDGAKDYNRHLVKNTPYREWYEQLTRQQA